MHSEMKERQRWTTEEDAILLAYVKQYGPREWHLVSHRMNTHLDRDAKSCLERWKNYLKPGIKKGSLTEDEQRLVIRLQAKHGNKWKKIAAEVPGRTAKRLGKWWEVYKEKQLRAKKESCKSFEPIEEGKYDRILETFAEKLVKERAAPTTLLMASSNGGFLHGDQTVIPPWLSSSSPRPLSPSVTLSLASSTIAPPPPVTSPMVASWLPPPENAALTLGSHPCGGEQMLMSEVMECYREVEEAHRALASHKKEAAWRLKRVELQLESEKAARRREKVEDIEAKIKALREEQWASLERLDAEYREQLTGLRSDAEAKEQKMVEQWATKHLQLMKLVEEIMSCRARLAKPNGH